MLRKMCSVTSCYINLIKTPIWPKTILLLPYTRPQAIASETVLTRIITSVT